jgi:hypothetical protein
MSVIGVACGVRAGGPPKVSNLGYSDTPILPGGKWHVHDGNRPQPPIVTPPVGNQSAPDAAPSDAVVLFDGKDLSHWRTGDGAPISWKLVDGVMEVVKGAGDITSREEFGDCQLHLEFMTPAVVHGDGQGRGNSGLFFHGIYEIQILDNYNNPTYPDGTVGAVYAQTPPMVNPSRKPGTWQTYDIVWNAPRFDGDKLVKPAYVTVIHNGIVTQNHTELIGNTPHRQVGSYKPHPPKGPIKLQDHGDPLRFRNIWVREIKPVE